MDIRVTFKYIAAGAVAVLFTWLLHEFAHWLTGELLGYDSIMMLNATGFGKGEDPSDVERAIVSIAGPLVTIVQAFIFFTLLNRRNWSKYLYIFLFTPLYFRLLASLMNVINLNDEGRVSNFLGLGTFTLPVIVSGILFYLVFKTSKKYQPGWKFQLVTTLTVMVFSSILILSDMFFRIRLL